MSDKQEGETTNDIDINNEVEIDETKSSELCVSSPNEEICDEISKDDESEKSFQSCPSDNNENITSNELKCTPGKIEETPDINNDEDDDDDIRPGSCRENPSSDDDVSSWDENNDHWFYDAEYIHESASGKELPKAELDKDTLQLCENDLNYIIENHVSKENNNKRNPENKKKKERDSKETNNPTFIPTNGQFYMHDLRSEAKENQSTKSTKNTKNVQKKSNDSWSHDLYDEARQQPISKDELINKYGEDIRCKKHAQELKENKPKKSLRQNNFKRQNYRYSQQSYYDYEYYDQYEGYDPYYYDNYYYDYNSYYNSWNKPNKNTFFKSENRNYKSNPTLENKAKKQPQRPPSKYSKIAEYTDIKITINLNNSGARQIQSISNANKKNFNSRTYENSNLRRGEGVPLKIQPESQANSSITHKGHEDSPKDNSMDNGAGDPNRGDPNRRNSPHKEQQRRNLSQKNHSDKGGEPQRFNRHKPMPDWLNTKFEWGPLSDFKDVIEEMPPLTEKEINQMQKRPLNSHNPPPRFSRDKPSQQSDLKPQNRAQSFVPKRYSELRSQPEVPKASAEVASRPELINYSPMISNLDFYNNLQPLLLNINQGPHSAPANSPQQTSSNYSSIHPQMVSLSSLMQPTGYHDNQQFYLPPQLFLPSNGRLNQFSQPFQPSFVSQSQAASVYPASQLPTSLPNNTPNSASQTIRPVLGKS